MDLALTPGGGQLTIRDAEEPGSLEQPTTLTGSVDEFTGEISGASFAAAPASFEFPITSPIPATVYIDAAFTEVTPGSVTGSVTKVPGSDTLGTVSLDVLVSVDLHIEVGSPPIVPAADCTASPVALGLTGTYDKTTQRVTLKDANFNVPKVPIDDDCPALIGDPVNDRLPGGGHAISMVMQGPLFVPEIGTGATTTSLTVDPSSSEDGDGVALTATVAPVGDGVAPTGFVEFRSGDAVVGVGAVDETGKATFSTSELGVGLHRLTAIYRGDPTYGRSESPVVEHLVAATPSVEVAMASSVLIGGQPRPVTVTVTNPVEFGADVTNARLSLTIGRVGAGTALLDPNRIKAEWLNGATWEPVPLATVATRTVGGVVGATTGFPLPAGTTEQIRLRVSAFAVGTTQSPTSCSVIHPTCPGPLKLTASLVEVDPGAGTVVEPITDDVHDLNLVESTRRASTVTFNGGFPRPHTVRQGYTIQVFATHAPSVSNFRAGGLAEILVDGERVPVRPNNAPLGSALVDQLVVSNGAVNGWVTLPPDIDVGQHYVTIRYLGDPFFAPVDVTSTLTVLPGKGVPFVCQEEGFSTKIVEGTNVQFDVALPDAVVSGASTPIDVSAAVLRMARQQLTGGSAPWLQFDNGTTTPVGPRLTSITFDLGPDGTGTAESLERQGGTNMGSPEPNPGTEATVDQTITLHGPSASITVEGAPGDVVPVELEQVTIRSILTEENPIQITMTCDPVGGPMALGEVEIAGTTVSVGPEGPVRSNVDEVTVTAETFPSDASGSVVFSSSRDGSLGGPVSVADGVASVTSSTLSAGTHLITALFNANDPNVPDTLGTVPVTVLPEFDCPAAAQEGTAAVVRLVYLELLGRCPDAAGLAHWKGRLDGGTTREAFARSIAGTPEAVGRVVDDAYQVMLGRAADPAGRVFWTARLQANGRYDRLLADLARSDEFFARAGSTNEGVVTRIYERLLGRSPDAGGLAYWTARLDGGASRRALVTLLANLDEPLGVLVTSSYEEILDRAPDGTERTAGTTYLRATGDRSGLYARLIGTQEFHTRAQSFPNPES